MKSSKSLKMKTLAFGLVAVGVISTAVACNHNDDEPTPTTQGRVTTTSPPATSAPATTTPPEPAG